jgi:hypothetical protein
MTTEMKIKFTYIILFIITFIIINSCERDDICIDEITPHLVIRFYNNDDHTLFKRFSQLSVKVIGVENDSINFSSTDSISIPLKVNDDITQFIITLDSDQNIFNRDTLSVSYNREEIFVGRSCGFKTIFSNANYTLQTGSENWILDTETITQTIDNETTAHVKIFH